MRGIIAAVGLLALLGGCGEITQLPVVDMTSPEMMWVKLPEGVTPLSDIGIYQVGYQRYGQEPVDMPRSWTGNFTEDSGIAFMTIRHGDKPALLLHCPWRGATGAAFVDYRIELPKTTPVSFDFAIAMQPDVGDKSDGVTFSASLTANGEKKDLMREHYLTSEPKGFHFDLSLYAGQRVVLRIQTEPGPKNNPGFDFSHFLEPRITVGAPMDLRAHLVETMTNTRAYKALSKADLREVGNRSGQGIVPSCKLPHKNTVRKSAADYLLAYEGEDERVVYQYSPRTGSLDDVAVRIGDTKPFLPCAGGGIWFDEQSKQVPPAKAEPVSDQVDGDTVVAVWKYAAGSLEATVEWRFRIVGKALVIEARSDDATIGRFSLGCAGAVDFRKQIPLPYLSAWSDQYVQFLPAQGAFALSYIDWTQSHASRSPGEESFYTRKLDGKLNPLREAGYVAVSSDLDEVLPNIPHPPSPYLKLLGPRMMLDIWGGTYEEDAKGLEECKSYGMDQIAIIMHDWQRYGYDVKLPDHLPANPKYGGDEKMKILGDTAKRLGYVFSLHENYIDFYPDAPSYNPKDVVLTPKGEFSKAWYHPGTKVQSFALKGNRMVHYAQQNSPEIHRRFNTTAAYLDVHTCVPPWHHVDFQADQEMAGMYAAKVKCHADLFQFERDTHQGPLFGEGANHFYWAGLVDGVEAQVHNGEDAPTLVDFDLLKLHPQMVNHGMGYYTRWLRTGKETKWNVDAPTPAQLDKYRAQELAYGHASFMGSQLWRNMAVAVREYNLCQPIQALYGDAKVTQIRYEVEGKAVSSSVAAAAGALDRLAITYDSGLVLRVNLRDEDWTVGDYVLPQFGFLAEGPDTLVYTAKRDGIIVDFARTRDTLYADSRTQVVAPWTQGQKDIEPRVKSLQHLGGRQFAITYEWAVNDVVDKDLHCFVHFCHEKAKRGDGIAFQNDHSLPTPTTQWKPGMVVTDGPHTVEVPEDCSLDAFDILIGLFNGGRVNLKGVQAGGSRIAIGRLAVSRKDGKVADIALRDVADLARDQEESRKRFTERMNTAGKRVDFGPAATDGSFRLVLRPDGMELLPFPRDRKFSIELDLRQVLPQKTVSRAEITAVSADGKEIGKATPSLSAGRLAFDTGISGAARYVIRCD